jgi:uncharacterized protein YoxC
MTHESAKERSLRRTISSYARVNAVMRRVNAVMRRVNGVMQRMNGVMQRMNGVMQRMNGVMQRMNGVMQRVNGVMQRVNGVMQRVNGVTRRVNALSCAAGQLDDERSALAVGALRPWRCLEWQHVGLGEPAAVREATEAPSCAFKPPRQLHAPRRRYAFALARWRDERHGLISPLRPRVP